MRYTLVRHSYLHSQLSVLLLMLGFCWCGMIRCPSLAVFVIIVKDPYKPRSRVTTVLGSLGKSLCLRIRFGSRGRFVSIAVAVRESFGGIFRPPSCWSSGSCLASSQGIGSACC